METSGTLYGGSDVTTYNARVKEGKYSMIFFNSEAICLEFLENLEEMFPNY